MVITEEGHLDMMDADLKDLLEIALKSTADVHRTVELVTRLATKLMGNDE
jgi:hypothetical protein